MNKKQLSENVAESMSTTAAEAERAVQAVLGVIVEAVATGDRVQIAGFGTFERRNRAARTGRNPQTGAVIEIAASQAPAFKPAAAFKDAVQA